MVFVDSNIVFDMWDHDPVWEPWSRSQFLRLSLLEEIAINPIIFGELASRFEHRINLDRALESLRLILIGIPREAAFLAGKAFVEYRKRGGTKTGVLPDFFIGAQASVMGATLLTRDVTRYKTYFPSVRLITP
jgi:predicted nucleic acid-binding protein